MDKLTACRILGLDESAGRAEIREAYAELSKKYHPEEHPEEFQQIHEAYQTLIQSAGRGGNAARGTGHMGRGARSAKGDSSVRPVEEETSAHSADGAEEDGSGETERDVRTERRAAQKQREPAGAEQPEDDGLDFDSAVSAAQQREQEQLHETVLKAVAEMKILLGPQYKYKLRLFREFFKKEEYQTALKTSEFMEAFADELKKTELKGIIYDYIIDYYRLKSVDRRQIHKGAGMLYDLLDQRRGIMKKRLGAQAFAIPAGAAVALRIVLRNAYRANRAVGVLFWCALAVIALVWLGRKLYENHSGIFAQFVTALILAVSQFFAVMFDFYAPAFGVDDGTMVAVTVMMLGVAWMIVLAVAAVVSKIKSVAKRK